MVAITAPAYPVPRANRFAGRDGGIGAWLKSIAADTLRMRPATATTRDPQRVFLDQPCRLH